MSRVAPSGPVRRPQWRLSALILGASLSITATASAEEWSLDRYAAGERQSGYLFLSEETRALQDDDFQNPGMFVVEKGRDLWERKEGAKGLSCASCHAEATETMRGVATRYPQYDARRGGMVNIELRINEMRADHMQAEPYAYESPDMLALSAFVAHQSRGLPVDVEVEGAAQPHFEKGRAFYFARRGQLDLSCSQCHDQQVGSRLRGDLISQGNSNGFPFYRMMWNSVASIHRMFAWCNSSVRAEPYALGSEEYLDLELYVAWRGRGLPVETPAVRR